MIEHGVRASSSFADVLGMLVGAYAFVFCGFEEGGGAQKGESHGPCTGACASV